MKIDAWRSLFRYPKLIFMLVAFSAIGWCLPVAVHSKSSSFYGLGVIPNNVVEGATRCPKTKLVAVDLLAPDDGARTLSSRPTFYWYIEHKSLDAKASSPETENKEFFGISFILRSGFGRNAKSIFSFRSKGYRKDNSGLYRFTLPPNSPNLEVDKTYTWNIRYASSVSKDGDTPIDQIDARAIVRRESNPAVMSEIEGASTDLARARIFANNRYWYDALDAYTKWIDANPNDKIALRERLSMLDEIVERSPKLKCIGKYNVNDSSLINSPQSIQQIMK
ncbi:MAG: hypothetical protein DCF19_18910 [Pseudanabaena frigida]|uniref:DUF928 domain-containing protein n=1 Tax=Pseudanabaena frigida TaxID=945775 RepID=A0A2W4VX22_9CYAN|nr:MAG: hypothetical protein DCF19_18910 [Pseudanabaena frigida]